MEYRMMNKNTKFIVLKYKSRGIDCIREHTRVLHKYGYCWFGKLGMAPSVLALENKLNNKKQVLLYCQGKAHLCDFSEVSCIQPIKGYPSYYDSQFFQNGNYPKLYFKLTSIREISIDELKNCVIQSSRNSLIDTISHSMSSFFYGEYSVMDARLSSLDVPKKESQSKAKRVLKGTGQNGLTIMNSCEYKINNTCTNKKCINYKYECDRPSSCASQRPILK